mmetsp:Transcript_8799/g.15948  ORF Transcript_8799/g.15948 Transcript_8799/m.15948 type:complete len:82 (+) Transcript_8799:546-791(+)
MASLAIKHWGLHKRPVPLLLWAFKSFNTATDCRKTCVRHLFSSPNLPEPHCKLIECLQCDKVQSGPTFQRLLPDGHDGIQA